MPEAEIKDLFPIPFMRIRGLLHAEQARACADELEQMDLQDNSRSGQLRHSQLSGHEGGGWSIIPQRVAPYLQQFSELLFGQELEWTIKEMWGNVLETGGEQRVHAHANSFISGIVYLSHSDPSARTVFLKGLGGREFDFCNNNADVKLGPYNADKWAAPAGEPGDAVLYPSYLLHEVPVNQGPRRMTIAFNAIPHQLDSWGYALRMTHQQNKG